MNKLKETFESLWKYLFESEWEHYENHAIRVHKKTGKVQYWHHDAWGGHYNNEPQFSDQPLWRNDK